MPHRDTADPQMSGQINALIKKYAEAVNNNDAAAVAALCTEEAVFVTPGGEWFTDGRMINDLQTRSSDIPRILATHRISTLLT